MKNENIRRITILHSNDMHGDFFDKEQNATLVGGVARMSGYVKQVRAEGYPTAFVIAGDMIQGSIIDHEYKGISTIDIVNMLEPDLVTVGNHELDHGIGHAMFLEKCAKFPIINSNLYIRPTNTNLFTNHYYLQLGDVKILFIGILTDQVIDLCKSDVLFKRFINLADYIPTVENIINEYRTEDTTLTVLLTHIGFECDCELAQKLSPKLGVDLIIGGHSHTLLEAPHVENGIPIVQVGCGTDHIGHLDLLVDIMLNRIAKIRWKALPLEEGFCPEDVPLKATLTNYSNRVLNKYEKIVLKLERALTHPNRYQETELGNFFADLFADAYNVDLFFVGSGSIRQKLLPAEVSLQVLREVFPYEDEIIQAEVNGNTLKRMLGYWMRQLLHDNAAKEFYQVNRALQMEFESSGDLKTVRFQGKEVEDQDVFRIAIPEFHYAMLESVFGIDPGEWKGAEIISRSVIEDLDEAVARYQGTPPKVEGRIVLNAVIPEK